MPRNLSEEITKYLSPEIKDVLAQVVEAARLRRQRIYLVGGIVRDLMLEKPSFDLDFSVEGDAPGLAKYLGEKFGQRVKSYPQFKTASLKINNIQLDIAMSRKEAYSRPGALPEVMLAPLEEDLYRRDFTVNAMALDLSKAHFGDLIDPLNGQTDLEKGIIRVIHDKSFTDDPTRIFRALRYEQRLGFKMAEQTLKLALRDKSFINVLSGERIRNEIELIFREERPENSLCRGEELGVWKTINSGLAGNHRLKEAFVKLRELEPKAPYPLPLLFGLFFFFLNKTATEELITRLNIPKGASLVLRDIARLKEIEPGLSRLLRRRGKDTLAFYRMLGGFSPLAVLALAICSSNKNLKGPLLTYYNKIRLIKTSLKGKDLLNLGFSPGPSIGDALQNLLDARMMGKIKSKKEEVEFLKKYY